MQYVHFLNCFVMGAEGLWASIEIEAFAIAVATGALSGSPLLSSFWLDHVDSVCHVKQWNVLSYCSGCIFFFLVWNFSSTSSDDGQLAKQKWYGPSGFGLPVRDIVSVGAYLAYSPFNLLRADPRTANSCWSGVQFKCNVAVGHFSSWLCQFSLDFSDWLFLLESPELHSYMSVAKSSPCRQRFKSLAKLHPSNSFLRRLALLLISIVTAKFEHCWKALTSGSIFHSLLRTWHPREWAGVSAHYDCRISSTQTQNSAEVEDSLLPFSAWRAKICQISWPIQLTFSHPECSQLEKGSSPNLLR